MRVLVISDVHANSWALDAVLRDAGPVDEVLFLGDAVNFGPDPAGAVASLRECGAVGVRGNHDHAVAQAADPRSSPAKQPIALAMRDWTAARLDAEASAWLERLPLRRTWSLRDARVAMCHATPRDPLYDYRLVPGAPDALVDELIGDTDADLLLVGHTHLPFVRRTRKLAIVNPGSVGQPLDGDPRAAYAVWQDGDVRLARIAYDVEAAVRALGTVPLPSRWRAVLSDVLRTGRTIA